MKTYPIRIEGNLDPSVSRWLWLVKWLLAIPHYVVLALLWLAFGVLSVVAFFAVLFTGHYPRPIFTFNTGVLRWSWRVGFYAYNALGTDRYPPFTLDDVPEYPARLYVDYPPRLSHGLVLVKWLLALPHLLVVAILLGGPYLAYRLGDGAISLEGGGLLGLLVLIAGIVLLFTDRYPRDLFNLVIGLNRWIYRVAAYVFLMTDEYPPFRLDTGSGSVDQIRYDQVATPQPAPHQPSPPQLTNRWTAGRVVSVVAGVVLLVAGLGALPTGAAALWFDQAGRDSSGYVSTDSQRLTSPGYALRTEPGAVRFHGPAWITDRLLGEVQITGTSTSGTPLFIGIATERDVSSYLAPVEHTVVTHIDGTPLTDPVYRQHSGQAPNRLPGDEMFWVAKAAGSGSQTVNWQPRAGDWTLVVLNADGSRAVQADLAVGATLPWLDDLAYSLVGIGLLFLLAGTLLVTLALRASHRDVAPPAPGPRIPSGALR